MDTKSRSRLLTLVECAIMVAIATVLSAIPLFKLPLGGSVTAASMAPVIFISFRHNVKWGLLTAICYSGLQILTGGLYPPPTPTLFWFVAMICLDYVIAFGILGMAGSFARPFKKRITGAVFATIMVCFGRFLCHYMSGLIIWGSGDASIPAWLWSLLYNGSFMLPETIITAVAIALLVKYVKLPKAA